MTDILLGVRPSGPDAEAEARAFRLAAELGGRVHLASALKPDADPGEGGGFVRDMALRRGGELLGEVSIRPGEAWRLILDEAERLGCGLIVIGPGAPGGDLGEVLFGETAERLAHRARQPVLIVRRAVNGPYRRVAAATDFSGCARYALLKAAGLLDKAEFTAVHAFRTPFEGFVRDPGGEIADSAERRMQALLNDLPASVRGRVAPLLLEGEPSAALSRLDGREPLDLVVLGAHGQTGPLEKLLGGTAERLLKALPTDIMLVREPE